MQKWEEEGHFGELPLSNSISKCFLDHLHFPWQYAQSSFTYSHCTSSKILPFQITFISFSSTMSSATWPRLRTLSYLEFLTGNNGNPYFTAGISKIPCNFIFMPNFMQRHWSSQMHSLLGRSWNRGIPRVRIQWGQKFREIKGNILGGSYYIYTFQIAPHCFV